MRIIMKKGNVSKGGNADKLDYFKKLILDHLNNLDDEDDIKKSGLPVGTIHTYQNGKKYIKSPSGKWIPKYDSHTRGAKMAISSIKRKVDAANSGKDLMDIVMQNRDRFSDPQGRPLPFVQELSEYVRGRGDKIDRSAETAQALLSGRGGKIKKEDPKTEPVKVKENPAVTPEKKVAKPKEKNLDKNRLSDSERKMAQDGFKRDAENSSDQAIKNVIESFNKPEKQKEKYSPREWEEAQIQLSAFESESKKRGISEKNEPEAVNVENDDSQDSIDFRELKRKYKNGPSAEGNDDEIYIGNEAMQGKWKLIEAEAPSASHDESTFHKTRGFPKNKDGSTINDRDYEHDKAAQEAVRSISANFDGRALSFDSPVVVTEDGIVVSGNNRTMSSKIAAREGTDTKYIDALKKRASRFGFKAGDIEKFKNPRIVFETPATGEYSTQDFAKYNQSSKKQMGPVDAAVKVSKLIKEETIKSIAEKITDFDTLGELYADKTTCSNIFNTLQQSGIITQFDRPQYITDETITGAGKEFLETVLIGSVVNEANIRGLNREGCKHIRQKLVRAITPLVNNKSYGGYSVIDELNGAIDICMQVNLHKDKFASVSDFAKQDSMFEENSDVSIELAKKMQGTQKEFADFMQNMNASLEMGSNGQSDIFIGDVETKDQILSRMLDLKKSIQRAVEFFKSRIKKRPARIDKSLTWSGHELEDRYKVHGMNISIENKKGSARSGTDKDGHDWSITMKYDYGYIRGTVGRDKDHLDCYVGPDPEAETVFIVHQNDPTTGKYDEDKVMLGFNSKEEAQKAYLDQYDRPGFLGDISEMGIEEFKGKVFDDKYKGEMVKALFTEDELRENHRFLKAMYDFFKDEENPGKISIYRHHNKLASVDGFPHGLDLENCELLGIDKDKMWFTAGGDWQQMVNFSLQYQNGKYKITNLYDGNIHQYDKTAIAEREKAIEFAGSEKGNE